jgi:hypothetical protein
MSGNIVRKIDTKKEKPIKIKSVVKNSLTKEKLFNQSEIVVVGETLKMAYTIFALDKISSEYELDHKNIFILLYLQELGLFQPQLNLVDRIIKVGFLENLGYIEQDYSRNRKILFRLTSKAVKLVQEYYSILEAPDAFLSYNRETDISLQKNMKSFLSGYFD